MSKKYLVTVTMIVTANDEDTERSISEGLTAYLHEHDGHEVQSVKVNEGQGVPPATIYQTLDFHLTEAQVKNVKTLLAKRPELFSGEHTGFSSGGNHEHVFIQLRNRRWVVFHSATEDVCIWPEMNTDQVYDRFWADDDNATELEHILNGEQCDNFSDIDTIIAGILRHI